MTTRVPSPKAERIHVTPTTRLGRWAVGLGVASIVLTLAWSALPFGAGLGFASGLAGGILALVAIIRDHERAILVFAAVAPMMFVIWFLAVELLSEFGVLPGH